MIREAKLLKVSIDELFLDPNNPRIVPLEKARDTDITDVKNGAVQATTLKFMYETNGVGVRDYHERLQKEGLLSTFPFRVAKLPGGGYVLNDGNTRVVAAKAIIADVNSGKIKVPNDVLETLKTVTVEDVGPYYGPLWLKMQSKIHLQGPRTWASSKRAGFVMRVLRKHLSREDTLDILHDKSVINRYRQVLDAYFDLRKQFPTRIDEGKFNIIKELVKNASPRRYLGWNQKKRTFNNKGHLAQFMYLIAPDDGSKPKITANNAKIFRTLGDDPVMWDSMVRGSEKDRKYLSILGSKARSGVNDMVIKLAQRLENITVKEVANLDVELLSRLVTMVNRAKTQNRAVVKEKVAA